MAGYARRPIGDALLRHRDVPVLILEGARAVGKTTMMRQQLVPDGSYSYASLADASTRAFALDDLQSWLRRLTRPAIIDEAQLLDGLPLAVKELVDELGPGNHFMLTGSASIGRAGLGGADPLTRRSRRLTMQPLTPWEIDEQAGSLVDAMFDGEPVAGRSPAVADDALLSRMLVGGFPGYVYPSQIMTRGRVLDRIRSDIASVIGDAVLPDTKFDATIARTALDALLRTPGGIFNASRLAQSMDIDRRTVDRYLSIFERLFLVHWLPNLATSASRQNHARSKIHPVDTSFAVESLTRAGVDILAQREVFGALLESHVVNQVLAATEWAAVSTQSYFWRQASSRSPEVDLVLIDADGRQLGIEVKASKDISPRDLSGLRALRSDKGLHRGFVVYLGDTVRELDDDIWALPVGALARSAFFAGDWSAPVKNAERLVDMMPSSSAAPESSYDATIFLSYVHDDDASVKGRIVQFARDLVDRYAYLYGHDLQLFVDRDDIRWGENWRDRLEREIETTSFLLAVVTPRYLRSEFCRKEVTDFAAAAKRAHEPKLLLPLQWVDVSKTDVVAAEDPVLAEFRRSQYEDVTAVRHLDTGSMEYEKLLERVAMRLKTTIDNQAHRGLADAPLGESAEDEETDFLTVMQQLEDRRGVFEEHVAGFRSSIEEIASVLAGIPSVQGGGTYAAAKVLNGVGDDLAAPVEELKDATAKLGQIWQEFDEGLSQVVQMAAALPESQSQELIESLEGLHRSLELPGSDVLEQQLNMMGNLSRHLRPMSRAVTGALQLLRGIQGAAKGWGEQLSAHR